MALEVPPIMLLYGGHPDDPIEVTPGHTIPTFGALAWFSGDERMAKGALAQQDSYEAVLLTLIRQRAEKELMMWSTKRGAMGFIGAGDEELQGVPVAVIAAWIGHKDASLTMRLYAHSQFAALQDAGASLDRVVTFCDTESQGWVR